MSISVYGGTGFIGNKFCEINKQNTIVVPRDQKESPTNNILYFISTIHNYNVFEDPLLDINTNLNVMMSVLSKAKEKYGSDFTFNFISSWFVYGKTKDLPANEQSQCNPRGFYSITKRTAEQLLISYCETFGIKYRIMRLCNVYGTEDTKASKKRNALQFLTEQVVNGEEINLYDAGQNIRDFMHVDDVCRAIKLILDKGELDDVINIGSGTPTKFIEVMEHVKKVTGSKSKFNFVDPPEFHKIVQVQDMYLNVDKLNNLEFVPTYKIMDGIELLIKNLEVSK